MGRQLQALSRQVHSVRHQNVRLYDKKDDESVYAMAAWDWHEAAPVRAWIEQFAAELRPCRGPGGAPRQYPLEALFGLVLYQRRFGLSRAELHSDIARSERLRRLYGLRPRTGPPAAGFPVPQLITDFVQRWWPLALEGDLSLLRQWAYRDIPAPAIARYGIPIDRLVIDGTACASPQQRDDRRCKRIDEGSGRIHVKVHGEDMTIRGRRKVALRVVRW